METRARSAAIVAAAFVLLAFGCSSSQTAPPDGKGAGGEPPNLGSFGISSASLGQLTISPSSCAAGDREHFLGTDLSDESSGLVVRLVVDPLEGPAVRAFARSVPFEKSVVFRRSECRVFRFSLDSTAWRINDVQDYRVSLELDCVGKGGDTLEGHALARHCH